VTGAYQDRDLIKLIRQVDPHLIWFPVRWPETWSYTLSAAIELGMPVAASNIGAFPERLAARPLTWLMSPRTPTSQWTETLVAIRRELLDLQNGDRSKPWLQPTVLPFYQREYVKPMRSQRAHSADAWSLDPSILVCLKDFRADEFSPRKAALSMLQRVRATRVAAPLVRYIPYNVQRHVKRWLSPRPLHQQA
jgi:hypothetical protein